MAYSEHTISALTDIPPLVHAFATTLGFIVSGTTGSPIVQHPSYGGPGVPGGLEFQMSTLTSGLNKDLIWTSTTAVGAYTPSSKIRFPIWATDAAPTVGVTKNPTKLFLIGSLTPAPYIAIVVEFGYNLYRHLYMGFMEKIGNYLGGEVLSSENGPPLSSNTQTFYLFDSTMKTHMFSARQSLWGTSAGCGGVHIDHADNSVPWRSFYNANNFSANIDTALFSGIEVIGGYGDSINDPLIARGKNPITGSVILAPINLLAVQPVTGAKRFRPIGRPAGVRLCNMEDLEPQTINTIGAETWRIFAATSKQETDGEIRAGDGSSGSRYRRLESSVNLGYAYRSN